MHPLAAELNELIERECPAVARMLSARGRELFFPRGILSQSQEAKQKAHWINATIGIATDGRDPLYLPCVHRYFNEIPPRELYPYAPATGRKDLREAWLEKQRRENPAMQGKNVSLPVVTNALTHGLSVVGDLFVDPGDVILLTDKYWGNYNLVFRTRLGAQIGTFPLYDSAGGLNTGALGEALRKRPAASKTIVLLNFPNNPTGYVPTVKEGETVVAILTEAAESRDLLVILDDAYFGLVYEEGRLIQSLFGFLCDASERLLAVKVDGATKEEFVWGFRCGFLTFGIRGGTDRLYGALEKKVGGAIRGCISNVSHVGQSIILRALRDPDFPTQQRSTREILASRARRVAEAANKGAYRDLWEVYPFQGGYFMTIRLRDLTAEELRTYLLDRYGLGVISTGPQDVRIAFSCVPEEQIESLFETLAKAVRELRDAK